MVIVDTSAWIPFFNRPESTEKRIVDELIDRDEVAVVGVSWPNCSKDAGPPKSGMN